MFFLLIRGLAGIGNWQLENPPVEITYGGNSVTLNQGERQSLGDGAQAIEVYLLSSFAMDPRRAMLQEGQPFYVNLILYRLQ